MLHMGMEHGNGAWEWNIKLLGLTFLMTTVMFCSNLSSSPRPLAIIIIIIIIIIFAIVIVSKCSILTCNKLVTRDHYHCTQNLLY